MEFKNKEFENELFSGLDLTEENISFAKFVDCKFKKCNLSLVDFKNTKLMNVKFENCKLMGINFSNISQFFLKIDFENCQINMCSFSNLNLNKTKMINCDIRESDFQKVDFNNSDFSATKFEKTFFDNCNLIKCNFKQAIGYEINIKSCKLNNAKFDIPEVLNLLNELRIIIE